MPDRDVAFIRDFIYYRYATIKARLPPPMGRAV